MKALTISDLIKQRSTNGVFKIRLGEISLFVKLIGYCGIIAQDNSGDGIPSCLYFDVINSNDFNKVILPNRKIYPALIDEIFAV